MISDIFAYSFLTRALLTGILVSITASLIGVSLTLRRLSMIGDGLSHVGFGALGVAALLSIPPMAITIPVVVVSAVLLLHFSQKSNGSGDSSIALLSSSALAIGVIAVSLGGVNTDLNAFLFGSILSVSKSDAWLSVVLSAAALFSYTVYYHQIYVTTFDPAFSKATGISTERYTMLLSVLAALVVVIGMRILGSLLISALIIFPAMTARKVCRTYLGVTLTAAAESALAFSAGFLLSYSLSLPTGASIIVVHLFIYATVSAYNALKGRF